MTWRRLLAFGRTVCHADGPAVAGWSWQPRKHQLVDVPGRLQFYTAEYGILLPAYHTAVYDTAAMVTYAVRIAACLCCTAGHRPRLARGAASWALRDRSGAEVEGSAAAGALMASVATVWQSSRGGRVQVSPFALVP